MYSEAAGCDRSVHSLASRMKAERSRALCCRRRRPGWRASATWWPCRARAGPQAGNFSYLLPRFGGCHLFTHLPKTPPRAGPLGPRPRLGVRHVLPVTGSSIPGPLPPGQASIERSSVRRFSPGSDRSRFGRGAVPPQFPHPPQSSGRSDAGHEHHLRGLRDDHQVARGGLELEILGGALPVGDVR